MSRAAAYVWSSVGTQMTWFPVFRRVDPTHADRPDRHDDAGIRRLVQQHQRVQRITIHRDRLRYESVVRRKRGHAWYAPVETHRRSLVIPFVLVAAAARCLD